MAEDSPDWSNEKNLESHDTLDVPAEESSTMEDVSSGDIAPVESSDPVPEDDHCEEPPEDPMLEDDLPLPPPMPPPFPSSHSPHLDEPVTIDNDTSNFLPDFSPPLISESPFKSITKTLSFLPSFLRPRADSPPLSQSSPPDDPSSHDLELQLESNGLENEPENLSEINYEVKQEELNEENNVEDHYEEDEEAYPEDNGYEPEYIRDTPEPDVDEPQFDPQCITRSKSVTFADDVESSENLNNKSRPSIPIFSLFGTIHRRLSDSLKPLLSPTENEAQTYSEPLEDEECLESNPTDMIAEDGELQNHHMILKEDEIEIHETDIDSSEVPMTVPPELEEALDIENGNQVDLQNNNSETLDTVDTSGVETLGEPSENIDTLNSDDPAAIEGNDTLVSEANESQELPPSTGNIPFSLGMFSGFRKPGSSEANDTLVSEANESQEPPPSTGNIPFSLGMFSGFRKPGSSEANDTLVSEANESQEPPPSTGNIPFSLGMFSGVRKPGSSEANDTLVSEANESQEPPPTENAPFSFGVLSGFRIPGSNEAKDTPISETNESQEPPPAENAPFSFGFSGGFRDLVPVIPLPSFPNSEILDDAVEEQTERVSEENEEPAAVPEVSIHESQGSAENEPSSTPINASGLLVSDRFGQDEEKDSENKDKQDGETTQVEHLILTNTSPEIHVAVPVSENETESLPPVQTETPTEITAETPPQIYTKAQETGNEDKSFKKQSSSDVPKRYTKGSGELMKGSSSSLTSLYSAGGEAYGKIPITGDVQFGLSYNHKLTQFSINVVSCQDLAPVDSKKNKSDPYVKVYLLPDKGRNGKRKTKIKKGTINPQFNELLRYKIKETELRTRTLSVAVWNNDKLGRNFFLGEVLLPLDDVQFDNYNPKWHQLLPKVHDDGGIVYKGDITLALKFEREGVEADQKDPKSKGALHVHFKSAKNLTAVRLNGSDPYAKCYLEPDRTKAGKRKTKHIRSNCNPTWDQEVQYDDVTVEGLKLRALHVTVWDHDTLSANDFLGVVCLSLGTGRVGGKEVNYMKSTGEEIRIWEEMLAKPNTWIEATIPLQAKL